jgi:hypothetical protein
MSGQLPDPRLRKVYRLEVTLGEPLDFGEVAQGHRRIVPQTGRTFTGPEISGKLLSQRHSSSSRTAADQPRCKR